MNAIFSLVLVGAALGFMLGAWLEAKRWRRKGDHEYMNLIESAGKLYIVKREPLS